MTDLTWCCRAANCDRWEIIVQPIDEGFWRWKKTRFTARAKGYRDGVLHASVENFIKARYVADTREEAERMLREHLCQCIKHAEAYWATQTRTAFTPETVCPC